MYIHNSLVYAVWNFHLNWLTFLEAMTDVLGVHFLSVHMYYCSIYIFIHHQDGSTVDIRRLNKIYNLTKKQHIHLLNKADQTHMQWDTPTDLREKRNTSIADNVTKCRILHTQESFDKKIITLSNFAQKIFGAMSQSDTW